MNNQKPGAPPFSQTARRDPIDAAERHPKTRRGPSKDGEQLVRAVREALEGADPSAVHQEVVALLDEGCERFPSPEHIAQIAFMLEQWPESSHLACDLGIRTRLRPRRSVMQVVYGRLCPTLERMVDYPPRASGNTAPGQQAEREAQLLAWFDRFIGPRIHSHRSDAKSARPPLDPTEYAALACLVGEPRVPTELIYRLIDVAAEPLRSSDPDSGLAKETAGLLRQMQRELVGSAGTRKRLRDRLDWTGPARSLAAAQAEERDTAQLQLQRLRQTYAQSQERSNAAEAAEREARQRIVELTGALAEARAAIARGEERLREREDHWRITAENQLARTMSTLRDRLGHELDEALYALRDDAPNLEIAVRRLQRARAVVAELEQ